MRVLRGCKEKGNAHIPLERAMGNPMDRFSPVIAVIHRVPQLGSRAAHLKGSASMADQA